MRLANTFSNIKVCLDLEQDWASLLKKGREKASPARDDGTSWTDDLWYKRGGRDRCPPGLDTQGTSPTPFWDRVFISSNLSCLRCWPVGFCQQRWLDSSSDPRHSSPLTKEDSEFWPKAQVFYSTSWSMLIAHPLNSCLLNAVFDILQALNVAICYHRHLQNVDCWVWWPRGWRECTFTASLTALICSQLARPVRGLEVNDKCCSTSSLLSPSLRPFLQFSLLSAFPTATHPFCSLVLPCTVSILAPALSSICAYCT